MRQKKGQFIGSLPGQIIALVVAIVILVLGLVIVQTMRDIDSIENSESASISNESVTGVNEQGDQLIYGTRPHATCTISLATFRNATGTFPITSGNYTVTNPGCILAYSGTASSIQFNNTNWNTTYVVTFGGQAYEGANGSLIGLRSFTDFVPLIVLALAASIIIGLILAGFAFGGRNR